MIRLFIILFFTVSQVQAQNNIASTGSKLSAKDAEKILAHHNSSRAERGVGNLTWSVSLAAYAQQWANYLAQHNKGNIKHRDNAGQNGKDYGENIFWGSSAAAYPPIEASYSWYSEKQYYKHRKISSSNYFKTGHYTQMVWKDTREMGAGMAICTNGAVIIVANYYPAGNVLGELAY